MSSYLFSVMAQSGAGSDWNWFLIFIIFVVILAIALVVQARFSKKDAAELEHHEDEAQHEEAELIPEASPDLELTTEPEENPRRNLKLRANPMISKHWRVSAPRLPVFSVKTGLQPSHN